MNRLACRLQVYDIHNTYTYKQARIQDFSQGGVRFNKILLYARKYFLARAKRARFFFTPPWDIFTPPSERV